jgi:hypothetical protein
MDPSLPTLRDFRAHHDRVLAAPGAAVLHLADVIEHAVQKIAIVEVNFDELIETHIRAPIQVFASDEEFEGAAGYIHRYLQGDEEAIPLLKLHGTISRPETCIISADQTQLGVGQPKLDALRALLDTTNPRLWVYVGASLRDLDLRPLLLGEEFGRGADERWVCPYLPESLEEFGWVRAPIWRNGPFPTIDERLISETADAFFQALSQAVSNLGAA